MNMRKGTETEQSKQTSKSLPTISNKIPLVEDYTNLYDKKPSDTNC